MRTFPRLPKSHEWTLESLAACHETVRFWWNRFGPMFAAEIKRKRSSHLRQHTQWRWHLDEVYVKINGEMHYLWRAVDHEGEVLESLATKTRDKAAALKLMKRLMKRYGKPETVVTDGLRSYGAAMKEIGNADRQEVGRWLNNRAENSHHGIVKANDFGKTSDLLAVFRRLISTYRALCAPPLSPENPGDGDKKAGLPLLR